jgi:hypothetical protein
MWPISHLAGNVDTQQYSVQMKARILDTAKQLFTDRAHFRAQPRVPPARWVR